MSERGFVLLMDGCSGLRPTDDPCTSLRLEARPRHEIVDDTGLLVAIPESTVSGERRHSHRRNGRIEEGQPGPAEHQRRQQHGRQ
jgi:hypothetical protein